MAVTARNDASVPLTSTKERYGRVAQAFHWAVALLFLTQYPLAIIGENWPRATSEQVGFVAALFSWHKTIGVIVFVLALARIGWALANPHPRLLNAEKRLEAFAAATIHWVLYAAILLMPLTGMVIHWASTGFAPLLVPFPEHVGIVPVSVRVAEVAAIVHGTLGKVVLAAIALHVAGALKHHLIDKDATLARMLPWRAPRIGRLPPLSMQPGLGRTMGTAWGALGAVVLVSLAAGLFLTREGEAVAAAPAAVTTTVAGGESEVVPANDATTAIVDATGPDLWIVDPEASTLAITVQQMGSPVSGAFERWDADIAFDPEALDRSSALVTIDTGSLALGTVSDQAKGADFLAVETHPEARFSVEGFESVGEGRYRGTGQLTIREQSIDVPLEFDLAIEGDRAVMKGAAELNRMDWGIGSQGYADEGSVGFTVGVNIDVTASRSGAGEEVPTAVPPTN